MYSTRFITIFCVFSSLSLHSTFPIAPLVLANPVLYNPGLAGVEPRVVIPPSPLGPELPVQQTPHSATEPHTDSSPDSNTEGSTPHGAPAAPNDWQPTPDEGQPTPNEGQPNPNKPGSKKDESGDHSDPSSPQGENQGQHEGEQSDDSGGGSDSNDNDDDPPDPPNIKSSSAVSSPHGTTIATSYYQKAQQTVSASNISAMPIVPTTPAAATSSPATVTSPTLSRSTPPAATGAAAELSKPISALGGGFGEYRSFVLVGCSIISVLLNGLNV